MKTLDSLVFSVLIVIPVLLLFRIRPRLVTVAPVSLAAASVLLIIDRFRVKKSREKESYIAERRKRTERILLMSDRELGEILNEKRFILIRKQDPDYFDALEAVRRGCGAVGVMRKTEEITRVFNSYASRTRVLSEEEIVRKVFGEDAVIPDKSRFPRLGFFNRTISKYFIAGCVVLFASFFVRYKIYYRIISAFCLIISTFSGFFRKGGRIRNS